MPFAIELFFDDTCDALVRGLWQRIDQAGISGYLKDHRSIPHITLGVWEELDIDMTCDVIGELATALTPVELSFVSLGVFPYAKWTVFLGPRSSEKLIAIQRHCYRMLQSCGYNIWPNYEPVKWVPHCTIGMELTRPEALATIEQLSHLAFPIHFTILGIGIVEFRPVRIHLTRTFGA